MWAWAGPIDWWPRFREALNKSKTSDFGACRSKAAHLLSVGLLQKFIMGEAIRRYVLPAHTDGALEWARAMASLFAHYAGRPMSFEIVVLPVGEYGRGKRRVWSARASQFNRDYRGP